MTPTTARQLKKIGFQGTRKDLKTFQAAKGLAPTGVVNERTAKALATAAAVPAKSKDIFITGMKNGRVATMEKQLAKLGYKIGKQDGVLDEKLMDAVVAFKKKHPELRNIGRWTGNPVRSAIAEAAGAAGGPRSAKETPSGLFYPAGRVGTIIGRPFQGTHTRGNWQSDNALDISIPVGTPIYATADGVIGGRIGPLDSSDPRLAGQRLTLEAKGGNEFYYAHLSKLNVHAGQQVRKGQLLGFSGSANGSPHLHLGVKHGDPSKLFGV